MINTVDSWFRDASLDAFDPSKHPHKGKGPGGGQFTSGPGGGGVATPSRKATRRAEHIRGHTGARHTRPVTAHKEKGQSAAAAVAAAVSRLSQHAQHEIGETGKEIVTSHGAADILTKGFDQPNTPLRRKVMQGLSNVGGVLLNQLKEEKHHYKAAGSTLANIARGLPMAPADKRALRWMARKAVVTGVKTALGIHFIPGVGPLLEHAMGPAEDWLIGQIGDHVAEHAIEEHGTKLLGTGAHAAARRMGYFTPEQRQRATEMGGGDSAFYDDDEDYDDLVRDFIKTIGQCIETCPIPIDNLLKQYKTLQLQQKQQKESDKSSPMFGGIGGNALKVGDEGTSEGAKKGWQHRHRGTAPLSQAGQTPQLQRTASHGFKKQKPELRHTETPPPAKKPSFEEMRAQTQVYPEKSPPRTHRPKKAGTQAPRPVTREMKQELPHQRIATQSQQFAQGERRSEKSKGSMLPGGRPREQVSMTQKEREGPGREAREVTARKHRGEITELTRRQKAGETLSEKEQKRLTTLTNVYGRGESQPVGTQQSRSPAKYEKADPRPGGRPGLRRIRRN